MNRFIVFLLSFAVVMTGYHFYIYSKNYAANQKHKSLVGSISVYIPGSTQYYEDLEKKYLFYKQQEIDYRARNPAKVKTETETGVLTKSRKHDVERLNFLYSEYVSKRSFNTNYPRKRRYVQGFFAYVIGVSLAIMTDPLFYIAWFFTYAGIIAFRQNNNHLGSRPNRQ